VFRALGGYGDFLNDYEGIAGYRAKAGPRPLYFPTLAANGRLLALLMVPTRIHRLRVNRANEEENRWLQAMQNREGRGFGSHVEQRGDRLRLQWGRLPD